MYMHLVHTQYNTDPYGETPIVDSVDWSGSWLVLYYGNIAVARTGATPQLAEGMEGQYRGMTEEEERAAAVPAYVLYAIADLDSRSSMADDSDLIAARIRYAAALRDADAADDSTRLRLERAETAYCAAVLSVALREALAGRL